MLAQVQKSCHGRSESCKFNPYKQLDRPAHRRENQGCRLFRIMALQ